MKSSFYLSVAECYEDIGIAINNYINDIMSKKISPKQHHMYMTEDELREKLLSVHEEHFMLSILASMENFLQIDFQRRIKKRLKDPVSQTFRSKKKKRIKLGEDIFSVWIKYLSGSEGTDMKRIKGAFQYRHWLAHGKYWTWKAGAIPTFYDLLDLAERLKQIVEAH